MLKLGKDDGKVCNKTKEVLEDAENILIMMIF